MGCSCEWKSVVGFLFHLIGDGFAVLLICIAFAKPYSECLHVPDKQMHKYIYGASFTAILSSLIHIIAMFKCIGTDDEADEPDEAQKQKSNKQYLTLTLLILLPNIGFTIYGAIVLINARSRPVEHEPIGIGIYPENYCYSGLWFMFHLSVLLSGVMILLAVLTCGIVCYQLRTKKNITAWSTSTLPRKRHRPIESSWNGSARYTTGSNNNGSRRKLIQLDERGPSGGSSAPKPTRVDHFVRNEVVRNSAKWNTPKPNQMKPDYDPYNAYNS